MLASLSATTSFAAFLPPFGTPRAADFAVEVSPGDNVDFQIVDERPGLVLGRGAPPQHGRTFHIDAGPYDTPSDAADALLRWISEYWECERVGDEQNSCFPYGGCHRRCWWRGSRGRVSLELELCAEAERLNEPIVEDQPIRNDSSIFMSVASYRDRQGLEFGTENTVLGMCAGSIIGAYKFAEFPDRLGWS